MNRYRNYMDRITAPAGLHEKLLAGEPPRRRKSRYAPAFALAAACCLLAAVGLGRPWEADTVRQSLSPTAGVAATPATEESLPPEPGTEHTLMVEDPFQNQPHGFFNVTGLAFPDCTNSGAMLVDYGPPEGWFMERMTAQDIIATLGGTDEVPWVLCWTGFSLDGLVSYTGDGSVWNASIHGVQGETEFTLTLWPGQYPLLSPSYTDAVTEDINGLTVTSWSTCCDSDGDGLDEYTYHVDFQYEDLGVSFTAAGSDSDPASWLACVLAQYGYDGFTTEHLVSRTNGEGFLDLGTATVSGDRQLTQEEAYEEEMSIFFPDPEVLPHGFTFASAGRSWNVDQSTLSILFTRGNDSISIGVTRFPASASLLAPDFQPDEVTAAALEEYGYYVDYFTDYDRGDTPGWRYDAFTIHYPQVDGSTMAVTWSARGIAPSDLAALVNGTALPPPEDGPQVFPLE